MPFFLGKGGSGLRQAKRWAPQLAGPTCWDAKVPGSAGMQCRSKWGCVCQCRVEACLAWCHEAGVQDAEAYLLERLGDVSAALELYVLAVDRRVLQPCARSKP
jgi:hypothetical protein